MQRILLTLIITLVAGSAVADEISVTEFVPGTTISSADMNQNFQTLVDESNENDSRISALESASILTSMVPTWVDGQDREIGRWNGGYSPWYIIPVLPDTDLVFLHFAFVDSNGIRYSDGGSLWYDNSSCDGMPRAQYPVSETWQLGAEVFITRDGYFAYASTIKGGDSWRASAFSRINSYSGSFECVSGLRDLDGWYEVIVTDQKAPIPIELPLSLRWR